MATELFACPSSALLLPLQSPTSTARTPKSAAVKFSWKKCSFHAGSAVGFQANSAKATPVAVSVRPQACQAVGVSAETESLNEQYGTKGVKVQSGKGGLTKVALSTSDGSEAEVYLYGGCITSWKTSDGKDLLFVRPDAAFTGQKPISGGLPHCFPQFGPGIIQQHGFARNMPWDITSTHGNGDTTTLVLELIPGDYSRSMWDYDFVVTYKIVLGANKLSTELVVKNTDKKPFSFTTAIHSYFRADISSTSITGLKGCTSLNKPYEDPKNPVEGLEERDVVTFPGFVDTMYRDTPNELLLDTGLGTKISIKNNGWTDAVIWNPYLTLEACYKDFVCVENAKLAPVELQPGESWTAEQFLTLSRICTS